MSSHVPPQQIYQRPGFLLRRAHQLSVGLFEQHCGEFGLTPLQYGVLSVLSYAEDIDQVTLSKALGHDKVTILHVVRGLEQRGLLTREAAADDRRRMVIGLTAEGGALIRQATAGAAQAYERLLSPLKPLEQARLLDYLDRLCDGLEHHARAPMVKLVPPAPVAPGAARAASPRKRKSAGK